MNTGLTTMPRSGKPKAVARAKTQKVQQDLEVAEAELHITNTVLIETLSPTVQTDDVVALALEQNAAVEEKVHDAAAELQVVTDLLKDEEAEIARLRQQLADRPQTATGRSGEGADSAMAHLAAREQQTPGKTFE